MSTIRQLLLHQRAMADKAMREAMEAAAAPYLAEMKEIDAALAAVNAVRHQIPADPVTADQAGPKEDDKPSPREMTKALGLTLKEMILLVLRSRHRGADALTILDEINARWNIGLERTSLSPQLSRLKADGKLNLIGKVWVLAKKDEAPDAQAPEASSEGVAGSPGGPEKVGPTGSTPVASTTPLFPNNDERKELE